MIAYRLSHAKYAQRLSSSGAANRWNKALQFVIYCSQNVSLCALELLAHTSGIRPKGDFKIMKIKVADEAEILTIDTNSLPPDWHLLQSYAHTQAIGSNWYDAKAELLMKVPSAIIQSEYNYVINTHHPDFENGVQLLEIQDFFWDSRFPSG